MCEHLTFEADVEVARVVRTMSHGEMAFMAHIQVRCTECRTRFAFIGLPMGLSFSAPMVSPPGFELRAPIVPDAHATSMLGSEPETSFPVRHA